MSYLITCAGYTGCYQVQPAVICSHLHMGTTSRHVVGTWVVIAGTNVGTLGTYYG